MNQPGTRDNSLPDDKYYLVCLCCGSRLEVAAGLAGRPAKCPTCGVAFDVPDLARLRRAPERTLRVGQAPDERMAVHAYAAAGDMAPEVVQDESGKAMIRCRRCGTMSGIDAESCRSCGIPFTIEAGTGMSAGAWDGWTMASVMLGILSLATYSVPLVAVGAIATGLLGVRGLYVQYNGIQRLAAWSGVALGGLALVAFAVEQLSR